MPWSKSDAKRHTRKARQGNEEQWAAVANQVLKTSGDEGKAIRIANAAIKHKRRK